LFHVVDSAIENAHTSVPLFSDTAGKSRVTMCVASGEYSNQTESTNKHDLKKEKRRRKETRQRERERKKGSNVLERDHTTLYADNTQERREREREE